MKKKSTWTNFQYGLAIAVLIFIIWMLFQLVDLPDSDIEKDNLVSVESSNQAVVPTEIFNPFALASSAECSPNSRCRTFEQAQKPIKTPAKSVAKKTKKPGSLFNLSPVHRCEIPVNEDAVALINENFQAIVSAGETIFHRKLELEPFLTVNLVFTHLPRGFIEEFKAKLEIIMHSYESSFGLHLTQPESINILILPNRTQYLDLMANLSIDASYSQGMYLYYANHAFVEMKDEQQVVRTALHEAVHTINHFFVGFTARWLNEGLAEYFETIVLAENESKPNVYLLPQPKRVDEIMDVNQLATSNQQWNTKERSNLYLSSFYTAAHLMKYRRQADILARLLQAEAKDKCSAMADNEYLSLIEQDYYQLQPSLTEWLQSFFNQQP
ncbi:hypothetical protein [Catenovulum maritimum]|uniref:DUF1570 domain-containing protein n=1 Tax=Catenovulum maritimum TaxID=1513271 RepID=A0A0J8GYQ9_9ALTE|nr:hypothetical protein [Catenovulum maritimum]KMT65868.1 hypothetical protein XM47_06635 [Catenovulum maritimum]